MLNSLGMPFYQSEIRKMTFTFFSGKDMLQAENITESSHTWTQPVLQDLNCPGKSSTCKLNEEDVRILPDTFTDMEESPGNKQTTLQI